MVVENFTIADVRTLGNAFAVNESKKWKSDFFKEKVTSDCQTKLRKKRLIQYYNPQTGKVARTALFSRGATGVVCLLEDAKGEKDKYVLKLYERLDENFVEKQEIISKTIKDWGNKGIRKYFVDYSYYSQAFQDWSDEEKLGSFLVMEQVQNSKPLAAKYISDLRNQKSTDEFQSILGGIVKEYVNLMKVLSKENVGFGDLAGDNLLVSEKINEHDGTVTYTLKLVDYDDMYVPGISGFSVEAGKLGFQHKTRVVGWKLTSTIHHFSSLVYYVSLLVCLKDWEFAKKYLDKNYADTQTWNILFKGEDLLYPGSSRLFEDIRNHKDKEINFFAGKLYEWACADSVENMPSLPDFIREFETSKQKPNPEPVPTPVPTENTEIPIQPRKDETKETVSKNYPKEETPVELGEQPNSDTTYTLRYDSNGGSGVMKSQTVEYGSPHTLAKNKFTRTGYQFKGWATTKSGPRVYIDSAWAPNLNSENNETVTLYAVWEKIQKSIPPKPQRNTRVPIPEILVSMLILLLSAVILLVPTEYVPATSKIVLSVAVVVALILLYLIMSLYKTLDSWDNIVTGFLILALPPLLILWSIIIFIMLVFPFLGSIPFLVGVAICIGGVCVIALIILILTIIGRRNSKKWDSLG